MMKDLQIGKKVLLFALPVAMLVACTNSVAQKKETAPAKSKPAATPALQASVKPKGLPMCGKNGSVCNGFPSRQKALTKSKSSAH